MLTDATTASGVRRAISESGRYRWRDPARVRDEAGLERLREALDAQAGFFPQAEWTPERREQAAETARQAAARRKAAPAPVAAADEPEPEAVPEPARCRKCTYPLGSVGHATSCGSVT